MRVEKTVTTYTKALILDATNTKVSFARLEDSESKKKNNFILKLLEDNSSLVKRHTINAEPAIAVAIILDSLKVDSSQEETIVYFGVEQDPFLSSKISLENTLKILEILSKSQVGKIVLQTRSPLILLATPILKSMKERLSVTVAVESLEMLGKKSLDTIFPKGKERILAANTLSEIGIESTIQFSPILQTRNSHLRLTEIAEFLNLSPCHIRIVDSQLVIPKDVPFILDRNAHRKLFSYLTGNKRDQRVKNLLAA